MLMNAFWSVRTSTTDFTPRGRNITVNHIAEQHFIRAHGRTPKSPLSLTHLVGPDALGAPEASHAAAHLHVLVGGVHLPQAGADVGHHPAQHLPAEDHAGAAHAEVLPGLQCQLSQLLRGAEARLAQVQGLAAVQRPQEGLQLFSCGEVGCMTLCEMGLSAHTILPPLKQIWLCLGSFSSFQTNQSPGPKESLFYSVIMVILEPLTGPSAMTCCCLPATYKDYI